MILVISGGRNYKLTNEDIELLDSIRHTITEIVSGGAKGVDTEAENYAHNHDIKFTKFKAKWHIFGNSAGHVRNRDMAVYSDAVLLFPGGKGTESMHGFAVELGLVVLDYRERVNFV